MAITTAYYNWAIAIYDMAKMCGLTKEAEQLWEYELSQIVPAREKEKVARNAISKFRAAIRLQFDFHRAIYNLGTVLKTHLEHGVKGMAKKFLLVSYTANRPTTSLQLIP
ncbi:hypothetical protein DY000_02061150 [Brassica cretica]|uniref:PIK-related kinase FAT domain-containing protein n=1 Tax=Brassica cretica TaxID=69181 RepID=A0ABQ7ASK6_BRACR|nr:hypothetical protein DY000_02061150 [Brassica cretica]